MAWATAIAEVRTILSDGPTDKLRYRKRLIGDQNGTNVTFKSFEIRRVTDFTTATAPTGVYVNNSAVSVVSDDLQTGEFVLSAAPLATDQLRATYYLQWFNDSEILEFLTDASLWANADGTLNAVEPGLRSAVKYYAACLAYRKLALRFSENMSETYQLEDAPDKRRLDPVKQFLDLAESACRQASTLRLNFYQRNDQSASPRFATISGNVKDVPPNR